MFNRAFTILTIALSAGCATPKVIDHTTVVGTGGSPDMYWIERDKVIYECRVSQVSDVAPVCWAVVYKHSTSPAPTPTGSYWETH